MQASDAVPVKQKVRLDFLDAAKGLGILGVMLLHSTGNSSHALLQPDTSGWWLDTFINRFLSFAVPMFLCVSAFLWARGSAGKPGFWTGTGRRFCAILFPYTVWSVLFILWQHYSEGIAFHSLLSKRSIYNDIFWGKAYFHLYFLAILLQAALLFPFMNWVATRTRFLVCLTVSIFCQAIVFYAQSKLDLFRFPGSSPFWYVTSFMPAVWLGAHWTIPEQKLRKLFWSCSALGVVSGAAYLWLQTLDLMKTNHWGVFENPVLQVFVFGAAFALIAGLALLHRFESLLWRWLCWFGAASLPFYLIHPMVLHFLGGPMVSPFLKGIPAGAILSYAMLIIATFLVTMVLSISKLDKLLFGRSTPKLPTRQKGGTVNKEPAPA
jgi:surface polysaccharide O-acyltransferase-like enzyme